MDSDLAWVNGKSARQSWRYANAFQRCIISEAIYHLTVWWQLSHIYDILLVISHVKWRNQKQRYLKEETETNKRLCPLPSKPGPSPKSVQMEPERLVKRKTIEGREFVNPDLSNCFIVSPPKAAKRPRSFQHVAVLSADSRTQNTK